MQITRYNPHPNCNRRRLNALREQKFFKILIKPAETLGRHSPKADKLLKMRKLDQRNNNWYNRYNPTPNVIFSR